MKSIKVCLGGATGWTGSAVAKKLLELPGFDLIGAVSRKSAGKNLGEELGLANTGPVISASVGEALETHPDVYVDYTSAMAVKDHVFEAIEKGVSVVVGSSGLTAADFELIDQKAKEQKVGVIAAGNFSITAALVKQLSQIAAEHIPHWEIIDYASASKIDVPSGTTRELAEALSKIAENKKHRALEEIVGPKEARGAQIDGTPVHSIRLPSYVISFEALFGLPDERLTLRHDAGLSPTPYVRGTLLAIRKSIEIQGLVRGLDSIIFAK